ncbi:DoxX family protein [Patescibacteria group bacterium]|nr:DoxX family protein [Patescibacteria group bacterium]
MPSLFPGLFVLANFVPLIIRLFLGLLFIAHGYPKLFKSFNQTVGFFESVGIKPAKFWVFVVGVVEFFGGIALLIGFATQFVALLIAIEMLVAIIVVKFKKGFVGGYELDLALLVMAISLVFLGAGAYAFDLPF